MKPPPFPHGLLPWKPELDAIYDGIGQPDDISLFDMVGILAVTKLAALKNHTATPPAAYAVWQEYDVPHQCQILARWSRQGGPDPFTIIGGTPEAN